MITTYCFENEEHAALRAQAERFAARHIAPYAEAWDEAGTFPIELYRESVAAGLTGVGYPEEVGGGGGDITHALVAAEAMVRTGKSVGAVVSLGSHAIALPPILHAGDPGQIDRFVRPVMRDGKIASLAITEPGAGSDVAGITTRAERRGDHFVVNGAKTFITSGTRADFVTTAVRTGGPGHGGISLLVIESDRPGFRVGSKLKKTGWLASDTAELFFDDVEVPVENLIGEQDQGFLAIVRNFVAERLALAAQCVAIGQLAYDEAFAYTRERRVFGKPITGFQVTRHKLADMASRLAAARALTGEVALRHARGEDVLGLAAMAKNVGTDMLTFVTYEAVQLHGGMGYMREVVVERLARDARLYPIGGGTREIMNEIIAKTEGY